VTDKVCSLDIFFIIWTRESTVFGADAMVGAKGCDNSKGDEWYLALGELRENSKCLGEPSAHTQPIDMIQSSIPQFRFVTLIYTRMAMVKKASTPVRSTVAVRFGLRSAWSTMLTATMAAMFYLLGQIIRVGSLGSDDVCQSKE